jgi:hypothetical protein
MKRLQLWLLASIGVLVLQVDAGGAPVEDLQCPPTRLTSSFVPLSIIPTATTGGWIPPTPPPYPTRGLDKTPPTRSRDELVALAAQLPFPTPDLTRSVQAATTALVVLQTQIASTPVVSLADQTRGRPITIAGRTVQLPADAAVKGEVVTGGPCRECDLPAYLIERRHSRINVGIRTGRINGQAIARGEEHAFDFLHQALC